MDKDDASDELFESCFNKSVFKDCWWGKEGLIEPLYFNPNMDVVLNNHCFNINRKSLKPPQYFKLMTTKYDEVISMFKSLDLKETNISLLFEYLDEIMADERDKTK